MSLEQALAATQTAAESSTDARAAFIRRTYAHLAGETIPRKRGFPIAADAGEREIFAGGRRVP